MESFSVKKLFCQCAYYLTLRREESKKNSESENQCLFLSIQSKRILFFQKYRNCTFVLFLKENQFGKVLEYERKNRRENLTVNFIMIHEHNHHSDIKKKMFLNELREKRKKNMKSNLTVLCTHYDVSNE